MYGLVAQMNGQSTDTFIFCPRLEAPRYRRVSPVSGGPQRLIITPEVWGIVIVADINNILNWNVVTWRNVTESSVFPLFPCADSISETTCCGSSAEEHHLHTGAIWQLYWAAGETPSKYLQVRTDYCYSLYWIIKLSIFMCDLFIFYALNILKHMWYVFFNVILYCPASVDFSCHGALV